MGKYAIIIVSTLFILLAFFVISTNRIGMVSERRNVRSYHNNQARNLSNSAAQLAVAKFLEGDWEQTINLLGWY